MTGLVEMASIPLWKQNVRSSRNYDDFMEPGRKSNDKYNISDIPSMNQNYTVSNPSNRSRGGVSSVGLSVSNSSSPVINNIPRLNEGDGNKVQFDLGSDFDTQETEEMGVDINAQGSTCRQDIDGDRGLSNSYLAKGIVDSSHLKDVQSNPFFKELGVTHPHGKVFNDSLPESPELSRSGSSSTITEDEVDNNYSPHSGIVEKLRKKFSNLTNKDNLKPGKLRHYGSLDNLLERGTPQKRKPSETPRSTYHRSSVSSEQDVMSKSAVFEAEKQTVNHAVHSVPKPNFNDADTKRNDSSSSVEEPRSSRPRIMSEEIKDIIIIEQPPKPTTELSSRRLESKVSQNLKTKSMKDETEETELPKPNTVSNFRSLFEAGSSKGNNRKILPDAPRSPQFISAARPPLPRSKPPIVPKSPKPVAPQKTEENKTEPSSSSSPRSEIMQDTSNSSSSVVSSVPSASLSSTKITSAATVTSTPSSVSSVKADVISQHFNEVTRKTETENGKVEIHRPPRTFESPVTKKKEFGEKKSIFDSASIETSTTSKSKPKRAAPKTKAPPIPTSPIPQNSSPNSSKDELLKPDKNDSHIEKEKPLIVKTESCEDNDMHVVKVADAVKKAHDNAKSSENTVKNRKQNNEGKKTLIFDSSMIKPKNKSDNLINPDKPRAPPRPKATAKKLRSNSIEDEDVKENDTSKTEPFKEEITELTREEAVVTVSFNKTAVTEEKTVVSKNKSEEKTTGSKRDESIPVVTPRGLSSSLLTSTPADSETTKSVSRFAPVSASEMDKFNNSVENDGTPTKGIPSIIANRLKPKENSNAGSVKSVPALEMEEDEKVDDSSNNIVLPSQLKSKNLISNGVISSPVPKKKQTNNAGTTETVLDLTKTNAKNNDVQRTNIDDLIKGKHSSPVSVFDSSNIPAKKKPSSSPAANGVPPLDLSLIEEKKNHPYQEGYIPTKIEPCKIVFLGAGVTFDRKPLIKTRTKKMKIQFNDTATATHEYQSESAALHDYLVIHPKEEEEAKQEEKVLKLDDFEYADQESSDDVPETPRSNGTESAINSVISHLPGDFGGYKSKMSMDFQFGMHMQEEEPVVVEQSETNTNSEDMDFLPAAEDDTHNWTDTSIPDMLF